MALAVSQTARAQTLPDVVPLDTWGPSGTVAAVARDGHTLYVGGDFDYVGPETGPVAAFALDGVDPVTIATGFDGDVRHLVALPGGGWMVAGHLRRDGSSNAIQIARLDAQGRPDPTFFAEYSGNLSALATDGARVFLGGQFFSVNGLPRTGVAAVDAATGTLLPWNPVLADSTFTPDVRELVVHQGVVYAAGQFTSVNGTTRNGFAALDANTGATLAIDQSTLRSIDAMSATGDTLYLVGRRPTFEVAGLALAISTGEALAWALPTTVNDVDAIVATPSRIFVAGFNSVRALDPVTGAILGPPVVTDGSVDAMAVGDGLVVVGLTQFSTGVTSEVRMFDADTGAPRLQSIRLDQRATVVGIGGGRVTMAGGFRSAGGVARSNLFALDVRTGRPTTFAPRVQGQVAALAVTGGVLVVGGSFSAIDSTARNGLAALTASTGALLSWAPLEFGAVRALTIAGATLHIGGDFDIVDGYARPNLAGISLATGGVTGWLPVPDRTVSGLAATSDTVFAVGEFVATAHGPRGRGAAFSLATGAATAWNPGANAPIGDVAVAGSTIGVVGGFNELNGLDRRGVGFLDAEGRVLPLVLERDGVMPLSIAGLGEHFFVGGYFTSGSVTRHLLAISTRNGVELWGPAFEDSSFSPEVSTLARYPDLLVVGGRFSRVSGRRLHNLAVFAGGRPGPPTTLRARVTGTVASLSWAAPGGTAPEAFVVEAGTASGASNVGRFVVGGTAVAGALGPGTYFVRVRAILGGVEGQPSSEVVLTVPSTAVAPAAPQNLSAAVGGGLVRLFWTASPGNAESYVIEAGLSPGQSNLAVLDTTTLDTAFSAAVAPGTYYVRLRARNTFGTSAPSNEVTIVVP